MSSSDFFIIPDSISEPTTSQGYLEVTGRHIELQDSFTVYITSLVSDIRGRIHILTDETGVEYEITLRFDGVWGPNYYDFISSYSTQIPLKPGKYTVSPKELKN